ncbi:MAG: MauE/DoxX family redox-associated membrane protein [Pseudomonadota bacterium]
MTTPVYLAEIARLFVAITLVVAVLGKCLATRSFIVSLTDQFRVPDALGPFVAWGLIALEATVAAALLMPVAQTVDLGVRAALVLFALFGLLIASVLLRRQPVYCYCFGQATQPLGAADLLRNITLVGACVLAMRWGAGEAPLALGTWLSVAAAGLVGFLMSAHLGTVVQLLATPTEEAPLG